MTYNFDTEVETDLDFDCVDVYKKVVDAVLLDSKCPYEATVDLLITDNESIREINKENRGIDEATDVLSFPMNEFTAPGDFSDINENSASFDQDTGELILGCIVLSIDRIRSQAADFGHSKKREFAFLIAHSMLHLIGYDHINDNDRVLMESRQRQVMKMVGILR